MNYDLGYLPHCEGQWNRNVAYDPMAIVTNYGIAYISKVAVSAGAYEPGEAAGWGNYWQILAEGTQGYTGQRGAQGYTGTQGATGAVGAQGAIGIQGSTGSQGAVGETPTGAWRVTEVRNLTSLDPAGYIDKLEGGVFYCFENGITSLKIDVVESTCSIPNILFGADTMPAWINFKADGDFDIDSSCIGDGSNVWWLAPGSDTHIRQGEEYLFTIWNSIVRIEVLNPLQ